MNEREDRYVWVIEKHTINCTVQMYGGISYEHNVGTAEILLGFCCL